MPYLLSRCTAVLFPVALSLEFLFQESKCVDISANFSQWFLSRGNIELNTVLMG